MQAATNYNVSLLLASEQTMIPKQDAPPLQQQDVANGPGRNQPWVPAPARAPALARMVNGMANGGQKDAGDLDTLSLGGPPYRHASISPLYHDVIM